MSVTTVPIRPIKKGSLTKYWIGIAIVLLLAVGLAWLGTSDVRWKYQTDESFLANNAGNSDVEATKSGLQFQTVRAGEGPSPTDSDVVVVGYKGSLRDGTVFQEVPQTAFPVAGVIPGFTEALKRMQKGGEYKIWIPSELGYGPEPRRDPETGEITIPANSLLIFEMKLFEFEDMGKVRAMQEQRQKMLEEQGGTAGGPPQGMPPELQAQLEAQRRAQQGR